MNFGKKNKHNTLNTTIAQDNKARVKKAIKVSVITFAIIIGISLLFIINCNPVGCTIDGYKLLNVIIIGVAGIGLVYCWYGLKDFNEPASHDNSKKDKEIANLEKVLLEDDDNKKDNNIV